MRKCWLAALVFWALMLGTALADGCFTVDVDRLDLNSLNSDAYVAQHLTSSASGVRVRKGVSASSEVAMPVRMTITQMEAKNLVFDKDYGYISGVFDSGVIYLPYGGGRTAPYLITLYVGDYVYALPYMQAQARLSQNGACTYGVRLRDLDSALGNDWLMGTMVNLSTLRAQGSRSVDICASNSYVIGQATLSLSGDHLSVNLSFSPSANVDLEQVSLYVITDVNRWRSQVYSAGDRVNVSGHDAALIYLPMQLSYDPAGLPTFRYDLGSAELQEQLRLWQESQSTPEPDENGSNDSWGNDGWSSDDGWDDDWSSDGWDDGWSGSGDGWM